MKFLREWLHKRRVRREDEQFNLGFGMACADYYLNDISTDSLDEQYDMHTFYSNVSPFDRGWAEAVQCLKRQERWVKGLEHAVES